MRPPPPLSSFATVVRLSLRLPRLEQQGLCEQSVLGLRTGGGREFFRRLQRACRGRKLALRSLPSVIGLQHLESDRLVSGVKGQVGGDLRTLRRGHSCAPRAKIEEHPTKCRPTVKRAIGAGSFQIYIGILRELATQQGANEIVWQRETTDVVEVHVKIPQPSAIGSEQHEDRIKFGLREPHADSGLTRGLPRHACGAIAALRKIDQIDQLIGMG